MTNPAARIIPVIANLNCIFLFLKSKIVINDITGIKMIKAESGQDRSINSNPSPAVFLKIPAKVTFITLPDLSIKFKLLPFRNKKESRIVNERNIDCLRCIILENIYHQI